MLFLKGLATFFQMILVFKSNIPDSQRYPLNLYLCNTEEDIVIFLS